MIHDPIFQLSDIVCLTGWYLFFGHKCRLYIEFVDFVIDENVFLTEMKYEIIVFL